MDATEFEHWLRGIATLSTGQRRHARESLAMSEASDDPAGDRAIVAANGLSDDIGVSATDRLPSVTPAGSVGVVDAEVVAAIGQFQVDQRGCPHCRGREIVRWGQSDAMPRYRCKSCRRTFNALTKTPLAHLRMKDKWGTQAQALIDGVTIVAAAKRCGVDYKTAFRWRHRFLKSLAGDKPLALSGIVESDETFILESFKGKRSGLPRKARKRGG